MKSLTDLAHNRRGVTLVELMIVVAVIGVLAAIGGVAYKKYINSAKISKLEQYAAEVANAQEQYKAHNSSYLDLDDAYEEGDEMWEELLGFSKNGINADITINTYSGGSGEACAECDGFDVPNDRAWFAVVVEQDLNPSATKDTTVVMHNELPSPMVMNEGD